MTHTTTLYSHAVVLLSSTIINLIDWSTDWLNIDWLSVRIIASYVVCSRCLKTVKMKQRKTASDIKYRPAVCNICTQASRRLWYRPRPMGCYSNFTPKSVSFVLNNLQWYLCEMRQLFYYFRRRLRNTAPPILWSLCHGVCMWVCVWVCVCTMLAR